MTQDLLLALGAGLLAAVNPCGFALLPAYLSLLVLDEGSSDRRAAVRRALVSTVAMTSGFVAVFGVFGLVISPIASGVQQYLPWVTVVLGATVILAGIWLLAGRSLPAFSWSPRGPKVRRRFGAMAGFGATYAIASLTCTIAPFLAIVVTSFRTGSTLRGLAVFVAYGLGMGLLVGAAALAVALTQTALITRLRSFGGVASRITGGLLVVVGLYVGYYGWWEIQVLGGGDPDDSVIGVAASIQAWVSGVVSALGIGGIAVILGLLAVTGLALGSVRGRRRRAAVKR